MRNLWPRPPLSLSALPSSSCTNQTRRASFITRWSLPLFLGCLIVLFNTTLGIAHPNLELNIYGNLSEGQRNNISSYLSLARLDPNAPLTEAQFRRLYRKAPQEARTALEPFGYYAPEIDITNQLLQPGKWQVNLTVQPGTPILIESVKITLIGPGAQDSKLLQAVDQFPLRQGDILNHQLYQQGLDRFISLALENGYQKAEFTQSRVEVRTQEFDAKVLLTIATGPRYLIGPLQFQADFIDHELLKKITPVHEGDPLSPKSLTRTRQSLYNAGYFTSVDIDYDLGQTMPDSYKVPITIVLTPNLANKYGIGLGYGTDTGLRSTLAYTNRHINNYGHQLDLQAQPSERKSSYSVTYSIPIGDPKRDRLSLTSQYETETYDNTHIETLNTIVSRDYFRKLGEYSTYLQYLRENYDTGSITDSALSSFIIPGIKGTVFWADDRISTTRGLRLTATFIGSEKSTLGDADFIQTSLRAKGIYSFFEKWRIIGRSEIGTTLVDDIYDLPPTLRFYAGGDQSVRGYGYKNISPTDADGNFLGGKNLLTYSAELERNLFGEWSGAMFYDSGTAMNSFTDVTMRSGAGIGLRWSGIFGQVRLDLAKALDEGGSWRIHFTLGADL